MEQNYLFTNPAVLAGVLIIILAGVFYTHQSEGAFWKKFYGWVPMLLLAYFLPSLLTLFGLADPASSKSLYYVASRYFLPASLVLLTLSVDFKEILKLGPKALIMFLTGTVGVIVGGPVAIYLTSLVNPELVGGAGPEAVWRGFSTVAGSWIGGGANMTAMKEVFKPSDGLYSTMVAIDVLVAEAWMVFLLLGIGKKDKIDRFLRADDSKVQALQKKMESFHAQTVKVTSTTDLMVILGIGFGITGLSHLLADCVAPWIGTEFPGLSRFSLDSKFFWLIVLATTFGLSFSFTNLRNYEGCGASKFGTVFVYFLIATIGLHMDLMAIVENAGLFVVGSIWMIFHVLLLFTVAYIIKAPYFFLAVGSKANIGGAASAPVVAAAFHPTLTPVGVLLAVLGYVLGTYGAYICALLMQAAAPVAG